MGRDVSGCLMKRSLGKQKKCHFGVGKKIERETRRLEGWAVSI